MSDLFSNLPDVKKSARFDLHARPHMLEDEDGTLLLQGKINDQVHDMLKVMQERVEAYLTISAETLGISIEELAEHFVLEVMPTERELHTRVDTRLLGPDDDQLIMTFERVYRLVPRKRVGK